MTSLCAVGLEILLARLSLQELDQTHFDVTGVRAAAVLFQPPVDWRFEVTKPIWTTEWIFVAVTSSRSSEMLSSGLGYLAVHYPYRGSLHPWEMLQRVLYTLFHAELLRRVHQHLSRHRFVNGLRRGDRHPPWLVGLAFRLFEALGIWKARLADCRMPLDAPAQAAPIAPGLGANPHCIGTFDKYMCARAERICVDTVLDTEARGTPRAPTHAYLKFISSKAVGGPNYWMTRVRCRCGATWSSTLKALGLIANAVPVAPDLR